uniref:Hypoxia up-regulated protein 1 n=1 Tax=Hadrurus spadix TaxID=141984 RepID=A0A1W7RAF8_9SCOR
MKTNIAWISVVILSAILKSAVYGIAVMSVDLGTEWMKVAIVSPGVPMEIALNHESQRKTPVTVAFRDNERYFGEPAKTIGVRFPDKSYAYVLELLAKRIDNPLVQLFRKNFPHYNISADNERGTVILHHPDGMAFTPEEIISMILKHAKEIASNAAGQLVKDAVITVPPYFNQAERRALLQSADMAGVNVLQLINSNLAVALNYGIFRRKDFNETPTNILFYDMGAGSTIATIASYQLVKSKDKVYSETNPGVVVRGIGFDRTLGGLAMQLKLRDYLAESFNKQNKTSDDVFKNDRAMAKLLKEAGRVKKVLSANAEHVAQVESLLSDTDFKHPVTREEFENLCGDLFLRVGNPVKMALESAGITLDEIDQVILAGAATRTPKVQQKLLETVKKSELGKSINADEAAALGAAYQAAHLSKGFKVKTFLIKDANLYPIQIDFQREVELEDGSHGVKFVRRTLFNRNNPFPQKKIMTFNRHMKDFSFNISYGELNFLPNLELESIGILNLSEVSLSGVQDALSKHSDDNVEPKGVKAHFRLDDSGRLQLDHVESVFEKKIEEEETEEPTNLESTLAKLGSTIGKLFSGDSEKSKETVKEKTEDTESKEKQDKKDSKSEEPESKEKTNEVKPEEGQNITENAGTGKNDTQDKTVKKGPKLITIKEPIQIKSIQTDLHDMTNEKFMESQKKLKELDDQSEEKLAKEKAKNALESFILESKNKLFTEEYEKAAKEEELAEILKKLNEEGDWLDFESQDATTEMFKGKLSELKLLTRNLFERVREHKDRPEALKALSEMLNMSNLFLTNALKIPKEEQIFTEVEINTLEKLINETENWKSENEKEQIKTPLNETPKLTIKAIAEKIAALDREVKYLLNKARFAIPKTKNKSENNAPESSQDFPETKDETSSSINAETETKTESDKSSETEEEILQLPDEHSESDSLEEPTETSQDKLKKQDHTEL